MSELTLPFRLPSLNSVMADLERARQLRKNETWAEKLDKADAVRD